MAAVAAAASSSSAMASSRLYAESLASIYASVSSSPRGTASVSTPCLSIQRHARRRSLQVSCHSEPSGSCCGGSGSSGSSSGNGSSCSSHGKNNLSNLGKEFEQLVASNTLLEFEKEYNSAPMEGKITRDIIDTVMDTGRHESRSEGEKFLDINEILREVNSMGNGDMIFSDDPDFVII